MSFISDIARGLSEGVLSPLFSWLNKKEDVTLEKFKVNGQVDMSLVEAYKVQLQARKEVLLATQNHASGRFMQYLFVYPLGFWFASIVFYCIFHPYFPEIKPVLDLPPVLKEWGGYIVGFLFLVSKVDSWVRKT
jgi:hypothetical protein